MWTVGDAQELEATEQQIHADAIELASKCKLLGQAIGRIEADLSTTLSPRRARRR